MVCIDASDERAARLELGYSAVCVPPSCMITRYVKCATTRLEMMIDIAADSWSMLLDARLLSLVPGTERPYLYT